MLLTLEKNPDGRPSLVRAGVGNIAVFGMSGSVHDRRPRNAPAGVICTRVPWSSHTIVVDDLRDASTAALTVSTRCIPRSVACEHTIADSGRSLVLHYLLLYDGEPARIRSC